MKTTQTEKQENRLLYCTLFAFFTSGACVQPLGSFLPFLREAYGLSYDLSGILLSLQSVGNLISVLCGGFLAVALGRRRGVITTAVWMAVAYAILASGVGSVPLIMAACLMTGVARGGNSGFSSTMISTLPGDKATRGYNLLHGAFALGALLSPLALVAITRAVSSGWRILAGILGLLAVTQLVTYARMPIPALPRKEKKGGIDRSFLRQGRFWMGAMMLFFYISAEYAIVGWLVSYFKDTGILSADLAQLMNSLLWLVILLGRLAGAAIVGKLPGRTLLLIDGAGFFAFFLLLFFGRTTAAVVSSIIGVGLFMATIYPTAFAFGSECIRGNDVGTSVMMFTGSIGGIVTPALVGFVAERAGITAGMGVVVACAGLLLGSIVLSVAATARKNV